MSVELWQLSLPLVGGVLADRFFTHTFMRIHRWQFRRAAREGEDILQSLVDVTISENSHAARRWQRQYREAGDGNEVLGQAQMYLDSVDEGVQYYQEVAFKKMAYLKLAAVGLVGLYAGWGFFNADSDLLTRGIYLSMVFLVGGVIDAFRSRKDIQLDLEEMWKKVGRRT